MRIGQAKPGLAGYATGFPAAELPGVPAISG
jgi:hypothetical protein